MKEFRKRWLKSLLGMAVLCMMTLKVCTFFINHFISSTDPISLEKSAEEGKNSNEESFDKQDKKLLNCKFYSFEHGHFIWIIPTPVSKSSYVMPVMDHPLITVPTPPPDFIG